MPSRRNLLILCSDQHNPGYLGTLDGFTHTPALDRLAAEGTVFTQAHCASPICVPARTSLVTGRYAHETGSWDNASPYTGQVPSWGHRLLAAGHRVVTVGKLHFREQRDDTGFPDQRIPLHVLDGVGDLYPLLRADAAPSRKSRDPVLEARAGESDYTRYDRRIARTAADWLSTEALDHHGPWTLFVGFVAPHFPLIAPVEHFTRYEDRPLPTLPQMEPEAWPMHPALQELRSRMMLTEPYTSEQVARARRAYYGLCSFMDQQVGVVLDSLEATGLADSTTVIYTSDHGDAAGAHGLWSKHSMYQESVGVPLIIRGHDWPAGIVRDEPVSHIDLYPTLLREAGLQPSLEDRTLPGYCLQEPAAAARSVFSEYHANYSSHASYMLRRGPWKYIHHVAHTPQLFRVDTDPHETEDLAADPARQDILDQLRRELEALLDPGATDLRCKADGEQRLQQAGGREVVRAAGVRVKYSPAPRVSDDDVQESA